MVSDFFRLYTAQKQSGTIPVCYPLIDRRGSTTMGYFSSWEFMLSSLLIVAEFGALLYYLKTRPTD
ncbi:unnamed protein product [Tuwongella immobilis]|uniref:Uncharacterized protein n=1 Tax=Tuwongella immobilis TaxID=692036 RepID=A0A6C2YVM6_9BACT|nr:unnamed protein product [Tuwongella immobilis]VTS07802.1 unnamed protein product [Tuwongella immobilis]